MFNNGKWTNVIVELSCDDHMRDANGRTVSNRPSEMRIIKNNNNNGSLCT